jgi:triosephosphate isomerase
MSRALVIGNWKMNGSLAFSEELLTGLLAEQQRFSAAVAVCPPYPYIAKVAELLAGSAIAYGAQNVSEQAEGAFTGEVAPAMLKDLGCRYALVGHSERRSLYGEADADVAAKFVAAQQGGITPVLCLGETLEQREAGETLALVAAQIKAVFDVAGAAALKNAVIAYEPVWAIGTGKTASPEQAQEVHAHIRRVLAEYDAGQAEKVSLLYGGSVKAANAAELFGQPDIDGALVGGASLKVEEFASICEACQ